ncbi:NPCBM/NEW2 domain-containing protein [Heyndrickxia acidicola]|uniref:NPCBM/NEW2 domain-containing protein n=1 Tax=Heyndrickxia acidicola TaxID=209389 RepID=UPI000826E39B|nr:NPCBM/NEW2 domain-containing protein [Heyndrickxia acidicola]
MKKRKVALGLTGAIIAGSLFSAVGAGASVSVKSLEQQIKTLQASNASKDKQISSYKKQINDYKNQIASKDKDVNYYKSYAVTPLKTKVAYQGNVLSGNYQVGNSSVPALFSYNGVRYAPVNLVGNLLGDSASYNGSSDTVFFGAVPSGSYLSDLISPYESWNTMAVNQKMTMGGQNYTKGYSMYFGGDDTGYSLNLNNKYSHLTGTLGFEDNAENYDTKISIYGDDKLLGTFDLNKDELPVGIDLNIAGVKNLKITSVDAGQIDFANIIVN